MSQSLKEWAMQQPEFKRQERREDFERRAEPGNENHADKKPHNGENDAIANH